MYMELHKTLNNQSNFEGGKQQQQQQNKAGGIKLPNF